MKQIGKVGKANSKANKKLEQLWIDKDIRYCEACPVLHSMGVFKFQQCLFASTNAHRHSRVEYRSNPDRLYDFNQVIRACMVAHPFLDEHPRIREQVFIVLRGKETC